MVSLASPVSGALGPDSGEAGFDGDRAVDSWAFVGGTGAGTGRAAVL